jgi:hypothetical protein
MPATGLAGGLESFVAVHFFALAPSSSLVHAHVLGSSVSVDESVESSSLSTTVTLDFPLVNGSGSLEDSGGYAGVSLDCVGGGAFFVVGAPKGSGALDDSGGLAIEVLSAAVKEVVTLDDVVSQAPKGIGALDDMGG